jgi:exopolysaccharide/PEP-CTERM locus tyrosine autokinase
MSRIEKALSKAEREYILHDKPKRKKAAGSLSPLTVPEEVRGVRAPESNLVVVNEPFSQQAEEYRKLKEALVKQTKGESLRNLIMVSSPSVADGKSVTAINLAASLAMEYDHTVLLVDADLRAPACHRYLGFQPEFGLSDCLVNGKDIGEALIKTNIGRLAFLPAGRRIPNPGEVFASNAMKALIREMKDRYPDRYIIIDTPPVLPFAETRSLSHIVDGVLIVVREGKTSMNELGSAMRALQNNVLGAVYNASSQAELVPKVYKHYS